MKEIDKALEIAAQYGQTDGAHHKAWVIDQMVRVLTGCPLEKEAAKDCYGNAYEYEKYGVSGKYMDFVAKHNWGAGGPDTYSWDEGIAP